MINANNRNKCRIKKKLLKIALRIIAAALCAAVVVSLAACGFGAKTDGAFEKNDANREGLRQAAEGLANDYIRAAGASRMAPPAHDEIAVSRAAVAKMIALAMHDSPDIEKINESVSGKTIGDAQRAWYERYVNVASRMKYMVGGENGIAPEKPLTVYEAQVLLDRLNPNNSAQIRITPENRDLPISYALWTELFVNMLTELAGSETVEERFGLIEKELVVLAVSANVPSLPKWCAVTDKGAFFAEGIELEPYLDRRTKFFVKGNEIAFVSDITENEPLLEGALVTIRESGSVGVFSGGAIRTYKQKSNGTPEREGAFIADVRLADDGAELVKADFSEVKEEIKRVTDSYVELEKSRLNLQKDTPVYQITDGKPVVKDKTALIPGTSNVTFFTAENEVRAAIIHDKPKISKMRVLINSEDYLRSVHKSVTIGSTGGFNIENANVLESYPKGETFTIDKDSAEKLFANGAERVYITPADGGLLSVNSITRSGEIPKYRGIIEVAREGEAFIIVNVTGVEEYLYSVVAGQIPEALLETAMKAQAVVARSGAVSEFYMNRFARYGANADDSSRTQFYNKTPETEMSVKAVNETAGEILMFENDIARPVFFLASGGHTANRGEAFQEVKGTAFPSETPGYLSAALQVRGAESGTDGGFGDLSREENAESFFKSQGIDGYEKETSWFRWRVTMTKSEVEASINSAVKARYEQNPSQCLTLVNGVYEQKPIESIGEFINMEVARRGDGGNIMELRVIGTNGEYLFKTENNIRSLIRPNSVPQSSEEDAKAVPVQLLRGDGTIVENYHIMPSAFYVFDIIRGENDIITEINFYGGGNGHGVGMSQCGAKALADEGRSHSEILRHFFSGAEVIKG